MSPVLFKNSLSKKVKPNIVKENMVLLFIIPIVVILLFALHQRLNFWRHRGVPQNTVWTPLGDIVDVGRKHHLIIKIDLMYKKFKHQAPFFGY